MLSNINRESGIQIILEYKTKTSKRSQTCLALTTENPNIIFDLKSQKNIDINDLLEETDELYIMTIN